MIKGLVFGYMAFALVTIVLVLRAAWVNDRREDWMRYDRYHFDRHAPTYAHMLIRFWIWDAAQFGYPLMAGKGVSPK